MPAKGSCLILLLYGIKGLSARVRPLDPGSDMSLK